MDNACVDVRSACNGATARGVLFLEGALVFTFCILSMKFTELKRLVLLLGRDGFLASLQNIAEKGNFTHPPGGFTATESVGFNLSYTTARPRLVPTAKLIELRVPVSCQAPRGGCAPWRRNSTRCPQTVASHRVCKPKHL